MKETIVCWFCKKKQKSVFKKKIVEKYKDVDVNVEIKTMHCSLCDHEISRKCIDRENDKVLEGAYRKAAGILQPEDILNFLKQYDLQRIDLSKIICISTYMLNLYSKGRDLSKEHNKKLIRLINDKNFLTENLKSALRYKRINKKLYDNTMGLINKTHLK